MKKKTKKPLPPVEELNDELFRAVERSQARAFISDGLGTMTHDRFFAALREAQWHALFVAQQMVKFLEKYDQLKSRPAPPPVKKGGSK